MEHLFHGFPKEMADFLLELPFRNTLENLTENKEKYKALISEPLKELYADLAPAVARIDSRLETTPARCLSSPYTDRRFSPGKPLKEYLYLRFKLPGKSADIPGLYFDMGADGYSHGLRIYKQTPGGMEEIRQKILTLPQEFNTVLNGVRQSGFQLDGESYQRDHYESLPDCAAKDLLNKKSFRVVKERPVNDAVFSAALAGELESGFSRMEPLLKLLSI